LDQRLPLVVSIVVNYDGLDDTLRCVESLLASSYDRNLVVVVDNASPSGDAQRLSAELEGRAHLIVSSRNLGYGGGANLGLRWALQRGADYAWVLNNDTSAAPDCIDRLVDSMESNSSYGVLSPLISAPVGPEAPNGVWYSGGTVLLGRAEVRHSVENVGSEAILETGYVTGCAMFLRCTALADAGLFRERLFLFWEDVDLSLRIRNAGWKLGVAPGAHLRHQIHGSVPSRTLEYYHFRNALFVVRTFGSRTAVATGLFFLVGGVVRRWGRALLRRRSAPTFATRGLLAGIGMALRQRSSLYPEAGDAGLGDPSAQTANPGESSADGAAPLD
jgi:hypothetical protein